MPDRKMDLDWLKDAHPDDVDFVDLPDKQRGDGSTLVEMDNPDDSELEGEPLPKNHN